jgi:hypothetical protein
MTKRTTPIVVGVADIKNRSQKIGDAIEPLELMVQAILEAIEDTQLSDAQAKKLLSDIDSISVVATWTWKYPDLPSLISKKLGVKDGYKTLSHHGGDAPVRLFDEAARRISFGEIKVAVVTGGEALASCEYNLSVMAYIPNLESVIACAAAGKLPPPGWMKEDENAKSVSASNRSMMGDSE